jgi:tetraprenyl-beta-curcumene synthase
VCRRAPSARRTSRRASALFRDGHDSAPLSARQLFALLASVARELAWGLPAASREIAHWRQLAARIPSAPLRKDALGALRHKRGQSDGAALFAILPRKRNRGYLRLLVAYQIIWDYLDSVSERGALAGTANGHQLHLALVDALDPHAPVRDYYRYSPWQQDGGYLRALVTTCRECCEQLPSYERVRELVLRDARRAQVLALNHDPDPRQRDRALKAWAHREFPVGHEARWYELTGAASAGLAAFALIALACEPSCSDSEIAQTHAAYFPWASAVACMLDSYADQAEDAANGDHSYLAHYPTPEAAISATCGLVRRCLVELQTLQRSERHVLIACSMVALYLSKDTARTPALHSSSRRIARAGGTLTRALLPVLRLWSAAHSLHPSVNHQQKETPMSPTTNSSIVRRIKRDLPPSPKHPTIVQTVAGRRWPYAYLEHCQARCGDSFTLYPLDMPPTVFLADPEDIRAVLTADATVLHPGAGGNSIAPLVGEQSFMLQEDEEHAWGRSTVTPAFHKSMVKEQADALTDTVERAIASWPRGAAIGLDPYLRALTLTVVLRIVFGGPDTELATLHARLMGMFVVSDTLLLQGPRLRRAPGWRNTWSNFITRRAEANAIIRRLVQQRRGAYDPRQPRDLLDLLLDAENADGSPLSDRQIRDNLMSIILAGHETTTGELTWAFLLLAQNQPVQRRLADELRGNGGEDYLTATIYEVIRHKPVFLFAVPRKVATPATIGDWTYQPPAQLAACTYLMHHNPALYPDPHHFCPERFLGASPQSRKWLPWGGGHKHCLGRHFAMLELTTILRHVLSSTVVLPATDRVESPRWRSAILVPRNGGQVILANHSDPQDKFF